MKTATGIVPLIAETDIMIHISFDCQDYAEQRPFGMFRYAEMDKSTDF